MRNTPERNRYARMLRTARRTNPALARLIRERFNNAKSLLVREIEQKIIAG